MNSIHGIHIPLALPICLVSFEIVDGPALTWWVRRFEIEEHWSELYRIELDLIADDPTLGLDQLIGADCELTLDRQSTIRTLCGVIRRASFSGTDQNQVHVRLEVVPGLALLDQGCNTRVWQHMSLAQIIERVLTPGLAAHGRELDSSMLSTTYPEREYVIQTRESDHAFARRLMAEAGIGYTFDHERGTGREVVVLVDSHDHTLDIPTIDGDSTLRVIADRPDQAEVESLQSMTWSRELALTRITRAHYDWQAPEVPVIVSCGAVDERHRVREHYDHDQAFEPDSDYEACPGAELNTARHRAEILRATSNVIGLAPGRRFSIVDHEFETARGDYVVTRIRHLGEDPRVALGPSANAEPSYTNEFECLRFVGDRPLRPTPRSKPRIAGVHTAIVTGPAGEEIHTDEHGRIKVRFYWERERTLDDDSSLWVRVAQAWAGAGFGMLFIPRVGMEVVVEFIEGDPDRPLVTGCVYNGSALPSLALPESNTQSTMRTRSSPGGAGYNELRFEDAAGSEQVFVHAQRDLIEQIEHEHRTSVGADQLNTVQGHQRERVDGSQTITIGGDSRQTVHGDLVTTIDGDETRIAKSMTRHYHHASVEHWITGSSSTVVRATELAAVHDTKVEGDYGLYVDETARVIASKAIELVQGNSHDPDGSIAFADGEIRSRARKHLLSRAGELLALNSDGNLELDAAKLLKASQGAAAIRLEHDTVVIEAREIRLVVGATTICVSAAGVAIEAPQFDVAALGPVTIKGATVSID